VHFSLLLHAAVLQVLIDHLAHGAERGAAIRGECGEVLGHGGSCHVGDDTRSTVRRTSLLHRTAAPLLQKY
jgi:hypothetical protein